jgi:HAD superfamily hydrolase (TIGR01509 family)
MKYLDAHHNVQDENEERVHFRAFFKILLDVLGLPDAPDGLPEDLAKAAVEELEMEPFPDTRRALEQFRDKGVRLGLLSNAWPSLERKYTELGMRDFFQVFVISARIGCCKPDERIFHTAIDRMELPKEQIVFVDDCVPYVRKAIEIGLQGVVMARHGEANTYGLECVESLAQLVTLIDGKASLQAPV